MTRRHYANTAAPTTLSGGIGAGDVTFPVVSLTGYPASFPYLAVIDRTTNPTSAELVLVTAATGSTPTVTRAQGGTSAATHSAGASFEHVSAAIDFDEANAHVNATSGVHGLGGSVVGTTDTQVLTNKTLTGAVLDATSTIGGVSGTTMTSAWTTYTPTFTNVTSGTGNFAYRLVGKTLSLRGRFTGGSATATAVVTFTLPLGLSAIDPAGIFSFTNTAGVAEAAWLSGTTVTMYQDAAGSQFSGGALMNNRGIAPVTFEVA